MNGPFERFEAFGREARARFDEVGLEVQTVRLATQPFPSVLRDHGPMGGPSFAQGLGRLCQAHGIDYCSIGPVVTVEQSADLTYIDAIPEVIRTTEWAFASVLVASRDSDLSLGASRRVPRSSWRSRTRPPTASTACTKASASADGTGVPRMVLHRQPQPTVGGAVHTDQRCLVSRLGGLVVLVSLLCCAWSPDQAPVSGRDGNLLLVIHETHTLVGEVLFLARSGRFGP
jgi:hypothetical protein